jgi:hypothetical protein
MKPFTISYILRKAIGILERGGTSCHVEIYTESSIIVIPKEDSKE